MDPGRPALIDVPPVPVAPPFSQNDRPSLEFDGPLQYRQNVLDVEDGFNPMSGRVVWCT